MALELWLSFLAVVIVAVLSPGPAVLLAVTHGSQNGVRGAAFAISGNVTGLAIITLASSLGVGTVLETSSQWLLWLRLVGGAYLIYLGVRLIVAKSDPLSRAKLAGEVSHMPRLFSPRRAYTQGVGVALSNPKALLLIGALFPQFIDAARPVWQQLFIMAVTLMIMSFSALISYAALSSRLMRLGREGLFGKVNKITGGLFVIFGIGLAAGSR